MKKLIIFALTALVAVGAMADTGWYNDYLVISPDGGANEWYWIGGDPGANTEFAGHDFGIVGTLAITQIEMKYWSDTQDRGGGSMFWSVDAGPANEIVWTQTYIGGNDYRGDWSGSVDVANGLAAGSHTLAVWAKSWDTGAGQGDSWLSNGGLNYTADFQTIPEPATMSLLGLGALAMVLRRKIRK